MTEIAKTMHNFPSFFNHAPKDYGNSSSGGGYVASNIDFSGNYSSAQKNDLDRRIAEQNFMVAGGLTAC